MKTSNNLQILSHIVGLTPIYKTQFINDLKTFDKNINIIDLDKFTEEILIDKHIMLLNKKLDEYKSSKYKCANQDIKLIDNKISQQWKLLIENKLIKEINKKNKNIILGLSTFFKNHKIKINILSPNKLFIKLNLITNAHNIITDNLDNYRNDIINGTFDLNYLNNDFLIKKRIELQDIYQNMGYQLKSYNYIFKIIQLIINNTYIPDGLFFVDYKQYNKTELKKKKNIIGYTSEWLALASIVKNGLIKGYIKNTPLVIPYIKEVIKNSLNHLNEPLFIYYTQNVNCFMPEISNHSSQIYKYISTHPIENFTCQNIHNPLEKLKDLNIKIIKL
jgi:hypothetical protein